MFPFVIGMPCQSVTRMLPLTLKNVVECGRFLLRMLILLCKRLLIGFKNLGKVDMNGLGLAKIDPFTLEN